MTWDEFRAKWAALSDDERERIRAKARWEQRTLWAVMNEWQRSTSWVDEAASNPNILTPAQAQARAAVQEGV